MDDPDLAAVVGRELQLLEPAVRDDAAQVRRLLHPEFREFGSSGRTWDRASVPQATSGTRAPIRARDLVPRRLGPDAVLLTYRSEAEGRTALRSSTWVRADGQWLLLFHQGTPAPPTPEGSADR